MEEKGSVEGKSEDLMLVKVANLLKQQTVPITVCVGYSATQQGCYC